MPYYKVKQGEDLRKILLRDYGSNNVEIVRNHPNNKELFKNRDEKILNPGDEVFIPEEGLNAVSVASGRKYVFRVKNVDNVRQLRLVLKNKQGSPVSQKSYRLSVDDKTIEGKTDKKGYLEAEVPHLAETAELEIAGVKRTLKIAHLDPVETVSGVQARLNNLGYNAGPVDGINGRKTKNAVKQFQSDYNLAVDGIVGPQTRKHLRDVHAC